jgi:hypothetical protein
VNAWAAILAGNLARGVRLPPKVRKIWIAVDNDPQDARWRAKPITVFRPEGRAVQCAKPASDGSDMNDMLLKKREA